MDYTTEKHRRILIERLHRLGDVPTLLPLNECAEKTALIKMVSSFDPEAEENKNKLIAKIRGLESENKDLLEEQKELGEEIQTMRAEIKSLKELLNKYVHTDLPF